MAADQATAPRVLDHQHRPPPGRARPAAPRLRQRVAARIEEFADRFGLRDYEGRTFAGWHHHVTLATAAHTFCVLDDMLNEPQA